CLSEFVKLVDAPPDRVLRFARMWGTLGLCGAHGLPATHGCITTGLLGDFCRLKLATIAGEGVEITCNRKLHESRFEQLNREDDSTSFVEFLHDRPAWIWEPVGVWHQYSRLFRSLLRLTTRVAAAEVVESADVACALTFAESRDL